MINEISIADFLENDKNHFRASEDDKNFSRKYFLLPFYFDGKKLENSRASAEKFFPSWGMTLLSAGTMRFRWNEENANRDKVFNEILSEIELEAGKTTEPKTEQKDEKCSSHHKEFVPIELIHSKTVVEAENAEDTKGVKADGIVTRNCGLIPSVTAADCVPIFLYDTKTGAIGIFHSGWKGTGIAGIGVQKMTEIFGSRPEDISAAIGPHIGKCCYCVDEERAEYFSKDFGGKCVSKRDSDSNSREDFESKKKFPYSLSLTQANLFVLNKAGIREENIAAAKDCTCCAKFSSGKNIFGSFRRQAAFLPPEITKEEKGRLMTVQAAFII